MAFALLLASSIANGNTTGAPLIAATGEFVSANQELSVLVGNVNNGDNLIKEYHRLKNETSGLTVRDIVMKATNYFASRKNIEKGVMLLHIATSRYDDALDDYDKLNCAIAFSNIGYYLIFERNNPIAAYPYLIKGLEIATSLNPVDKDLHITLINTIAATNTNIAKIFSIFKDSSRALHYYREAYSIAEEDQNPIAVPMAITDLMHYAWSMDSLSSAKQQIDSFMKSAVPDNALRVMYEYAKTMARGADRYANGDYEASIALIDSASGLLDPLVDDRRYIVMNRIIAGKTAMAKADYAQARGYLADADSMIRNGKLEDMYDLIYVSHADLYRASGQLEMADTYRNEGLRVRDSLNHLQSYSVIRNMELSLQAKDYDDKLSESRLETRRWIYTAIGAGILILVICILSVRILIKNRRLKEQTETLFRKNLELMDRVPSQRNNPGIPVESKESESPEDDSINTDTIEPAAIQSTTREEEEAKTIYAKVQEYMATNDAIFSPSFTIDSLAEALGIKVKEASQAINNVGGKNFNTLLSEYRVKEACRRMLQTDVDPSQRPTIEALADEVGYKSRTHFMRVFKSVTGLTTTEFLRQAAAK